MDPYTAISTRTTPQSQPATPEQVPNAAGGYTFTLDQDSRVHRFLTIGTVGGTYYTSERDLTATEAGVVLDAARRDASALVAQVVAVSTAGRAPRQNPALFALAAAASLGDDTGRKAALDALPQVARTGTHLFLFARYVQQFRSWGRGLRRAVADWYTTKTPDAVAYQVVKYRQREGWSHRDLLRLAHPRTGDPALRALFEWITRGGTTDDTPSLVGGFVQAQAASGAAEWVRLIEAHPLSWEMLPDAALTQPAVWEALIAKGMPQTALLRQLPRLTRLGVLTGATRTTVTEQLTDGGRLRKGRVHPINVLVAARTYAAGQSARGTGSWSPDRRIVDALDAAFYAAYGAIDAAGKRTLVALDVSGSMDWNSGGYPITAREVAAAVGLVTMATEPDCDVVGFTGQLRELSISPRQRLDDVIRAVSRLPFGSTDCAQPMLWAAKQRRDYDTFIVITDNETWYRSTHPHQALARYREQTGIPARSVVIGVTATEFTIADPTDPGMLDVAGFDAAVPNLVADFSRGDV